MLAPLRLLALIVSVLLLAAESGRAQIKSAFRTVDGDRISIGTRDGRGDGPVRLCLHVPRDMTQRQIQIHGFATLTAADGSTHCVLVPSIEIRLEFIKSARSGITLGVGQSKLDLSGYGQGTAILTWERN